MIVQTSAQKATAKTADATEVVDLATGYQELQIILKSENNKMLEVCFCHELVFSTKIVGCAQKATVKPVDATDIDGSSNWISITANYPDCAI